MATRNWEELGISWDEGLVKRNDGTTFAGAQLPVIVDLVKWHEALRAAGGDGAHVVNASNSPKVKAQAFKRDNPDWGKEKLREAIWSWMCGQRLAASAPPRVIHVQVLNFPDGKKYEGTSRTDFIAGYMAAGLDVGLPADLARQVAENIAEQNPHLV